MEKDSDEKKLLHRFLLMSFPIGLQSMVTSLVNTIDTLMIGRLGDLELSAVGLVNQIYFIMTLIIVGTSSGTTIFMSQFFGKNDIKKMKAVAALGGTVMFAASAVFMLIGIGIPEVVLGFFSDEPEVITCAAAYFQVVSFSYLAVSASQLMNLILKNIGRVTLPLVTTSIAIAANILLNYCFIFGNLGAPQLGVVGAAAATLIARILEAAILMVAVYGFHSSYAPHFKDIRHISKELVQRFAVVALPVTVSETVWSIGTSMYSKVYYHMGYEYGAAVNIAKVCDQLLCCFFKGSGQAGAIILGRYLGQGQNEKAIRAATRMGFYNTVAGVIVGVIMFSMRGTLLQFYNISESVRDTASLMIAYMAVMMPFRGFTWLHISSTLRAGGDTKVCMLIDNVTVWCIAVPFAFITGYWLNLGIEIVYLCVVLDDITKTVFCALRVHSRKWIRNLT